MGCHRCSGVQVKSVSRKVYSHAYWSLKIYDAPTSNMRRAIHAAIIGTKNALWMDFQ